MKFDKVAIVGLGNMGKAMTQQFSKGGMEVHGWNRSEGKRKEVSELHLAKVSVYEDLAECIANVDLVIMNVLGDQDLHTANQVFQSIPASCWKDKTIVQFTSQDALSISDQEKMVSSQLGGKLIGGAMLASPEDIGTDHAMFLLSTGPSFQTEMEATHEVIQALGMVQSIPGDVGYAALLDFGLVEGIFFGLAGHELCFKLLQKYGASTEIQQSYADMMDTTLFAIAKSTYAATSKAFLNGNDWKGQGKVFSAGAMLAAVTMHTHFVEKMGLGRSNFMTEYLKSLQKVENMNYGCSQIVDVYEKDGSN